MDLVAIPFALRHRKQWVARDADKKPFCAPGRMASSTDASTWLTFDDALALAAAQGMPGVGYVFADEDPYTGVDLDHCRDPQTGIVADWAERLIERLNSYAEISPSGTGVHIIVEATLPGPGRKRNRDSGAIEMYDRARYFTVSGLRIPTSPSGITERQAVVTDIYERLGSEPSGTGNGTVAQATIPTLALTPEDEAVVARIEASKESSAFHRLFYAGETRPNRTASENDLELATILCRYLADDAGVERVMRASPLRRDKWDRRGDDYLQRTIRSARRKTGTTATAAGAQPDAGFVEFGAVHDAPPPAIGWLVESIWPEGARGWIAGEAKLGKSWIALELAVCIAAGTPFLGRYPVVKSGPVFYLTEESNLRNLYNRLRMILLGKALAPDALRGKLHLLVRKRVKLTDPSWRTRIVMAIDKEQPVVTFLDPLRRYHDGGENDSADLVAVLDAAAEFQDHGTAVPIVHHMRKASESNSDARAGQQMRGSSDLHAWGDAALYCTGIKDNKNVVNVEVELKDEESPPSFVVGIEYGEPQQVLIGAEETEMRTATLTVRDEVSLDQVRVRDVATRVHDFLRAQTERQNVNQIKAAVPGRDKLITPALELLRKEGQADMEPGARGAKLWSARTGSPDADTDAPSPF